jgi:hypothetical protein
MRARSMLPALIAGIVINAIAPNSFAATGTVTLDWSQLKVQVLPLDSGPAPTLTLSGQSTHLRGNADTPGDGSESFDHVVNNWSDARSYDAHTDHGETTVSASSSLLSLSASASVPVFCCSTDGNGAIDRTANFSLNRPGSVLFSIPYTLSVGGASFSDFSQIHIAGSASFFAFDNNGSTSADGSRSLFFDSSNPTSTSGTLVFGLLASTAGSGSVDFSASIGASAFGGSFIPEPSVAWAALGGFGLMLVIARRRIAVA